MENPIHTREVRPDRFYVGHVGFDNTQEARTIEVPEVGGSARREVIDDRDLVATLDERRCQMAADEPGAAGYQATHGTNRW